MALIVTGIRSFQRVSPVPEQIQTEFVPLPRVTSVAYELDPRLDLEQ